MPPAPSDTWVDILTYLLGLGITVIAGPFFDDSESRSGISRLHCPGHQSLIIRSLCQFTGSDFRPGGCRHRGQSHQCDGIVWSLNCDRYNP